MSTNDPAINELATTYNIAPDTLRLVIDEIAGQTGARAFYIFWTSASGSSNRAACPGASRTLLAFSTPDAALSFAQRNRLGRDGEHPRLRRLNLVQLFHAVLREPAIIAIRLIYAEPADTPAGRLPEGLHIERAAIIQRLNAHCS
jgi:hypothetical protein